MRATPVKIKNEGFSITDICDAVPVIEVGASGIAVLYVKSEGGEVVQSIPLTPEDIVHLRAALDATRRQGVVKKPGPRLTEDQVYEIRDRLHRGARAERLAEDFDVSEATISSIRHRRTWAHLPVRKS